MAEKRKDSKGRNLLTGESQRKDGTYMYRYTDEYGKRITVYAKTLNDLRTKEKTLQRDKEDGILTKAGNMTVAELVDLYVEMNKNWSASTERSRREYAEKIRNNKLGKMKIVAVKPSHIQALYAELNEAGMKAGSISATYHRLLRPAFEKAVRDDFIRKNPAQIDMSFLKKRHEKNCYLTKEQQENFLNYAKQQDELYYHILNIMFETGLRISEMLGLTLADIDMDQRTININHQMLYERKSKEKYVHTMNIAPLKTGESGKREVYITNVAYLSFEFLMKWRHKDTTFAIDGYTDFLLATGKRSGVVTHVMLTKHMKALVDGYNSCHEKLPPITPHSTRHTFCTRMIESGLDVKSVQYLMGHKKLDMTMNVYTHWTSKQAVEQMKSITE